SWTGKPRENLAQKTRSNNINSARWDSKLRGGPHWVHFGEGAKEHDGEPFLYCLCCKATLRHPSAFNVGTTHMKTHLSSDKFVSASGRNRQDISSMFEKVRNYAGLPQRIDQVTNTDRLKNLPLHQWPNLARTSRSQLAFIQTTLHRSRRGWQLRPHRLEYEFLRGDAQKAIYLGNKLIQLTRDVGVTNRALAIVSENASVNTALAKRFQANV